MNPRTHDFVIMVEIPVPSSVLNVTDSEMEAPVQLNRLNFELNDDHFALFVAFLNK